MPRNNFGKYFLSGFQDTFNPTFQNVLHNLQIKDRQKERREWAEQQEEKQRQRLQGQSQALTNFALGGEDRQIPQETVTESSPRVVPNQYEFHEYTPQENLGQLKKGLGNNPYQYYNALQKMLNQEPEKDSYSYLKFDDPEAIWGFSKNQQKMVKIQDDNPLFRMNIKPINTVTGYGKNNEKIIRKFYTDEDAEALGLESNYEDIPTGFYKTTSSKGGTVDVFDLDKYKQFLQNFEADYAQVNKSAGAYLTKGEPNQPLRELVNANMDEKEITFYNGLIPSAQNYINANYYNQLKSTGVPSEIEYENREQLKAIFVKDVKKDYEDGELTGVNHSQFPKPEGISQDEWNREIEAQTYKSILLWAKLKFDRL